MMVGRAVSASISGKVSTRAQLTFVSLLAILLIVVAIIVPESVRISHIFIRQVPVNRKAIMDTLLAEKFDKAKKAYYKELRDKAKITCFIYPDMVFQ